MADCVQGNKELESRNEKIKKGVDFSKYCYATDHVPGGGGSPILLGLPPNASQAESLPPYGYSPYLENGKTRGNKLKPCRGQCSNQIPARRKALRGDGEKGGRKFRNWYIPGVRERGRLEVGGG